MPLTIQNLLNSEQKLVTVPPEASLQTALDLMIEHDFSQLPIVDVNNIPQGLVTSDSMLRALNDFGVALESLRVADAMVKAREYRAGDGLFDLLRELRDTSAVLIVDSDRHLTGIVTSYDTTEYLRRRA